ncbi:MAG: phosphoribosylformylglycinamidine cyclo-ligase [Clostridiales bacterium]|nr:phosphoribosylformylglycinamidine cyclo-ligase [Clostridiales bacterium]
MDYQASGVSIDRGNETVNRIKPWVEKTRRPEQLGGLGGFGGLFQLDVSKYRQPVLVSGTDGVGTKLAIAHQAGIHNTIGIDGVAMCVNDILVSGAEPLFFLDYLATGILEPEIAEAVVAGVSEGCCQAGCALVGGETAEMPGFYRPGEYDLAGFAVGVVEKEEIIDGSGIRAGDVLVGVASSGVHSNGFSLTRKIVFDHAGLKLGDTVPEWGGTVTEVLLNPTRIYVSLVMKLLAAGNRIKGMSHITGGGLLENPNRVLPKGLDLELQYGSWPVPGVFRWLQDKGGVPIMEMLRTYNMGIGFCFYVEADQADRFRSELAAAGEDSWVIGRVVQAEAANREVSAGYEGANRQNGASEPSASGGGNVTVKGI